jgi:hypothetical protein
MKSAGMGGSVPGRLYSALARDKLQHDSVVAAIGPTQARSFESFMNVLQAAAKSLPEASPTATDMGVTVGGVSGKLKAAGKLLSPSTYWSAGDTVISGIEALREPGARIKLAEYLLSDEGMKAIQSFRALSRPTQSSIIAASQVLQNAGVIASGVRKPSDIVPTPPDPSEPQLGAP